jgi:hypothetical protein
MGEEAARAPVAQAAATTTAALNFMMTVKFGLEGLDEASDR